MAFLSGPCITLIQRPSGSSELKYPDSIKQRIQLANVEELRKDTLSRFLSYDAPLSNGRATSLPKATRRESAQQ